MRELFLVEQKNITRYTDATVSQLQQTLESSDGLFWLDIEQMTDEDASFLMEFKEFLFHPLTIDECRQAHGQPYISEYPEYLFMVLYFTETLETPPVKLGAFLTPDFLVTVHGTPLTHLQQVKDRIEQEYQLLRSPGHALGLILHAVLDQFAPLVAQMETEISELNERMEEDWSPDGFQTITGLQRRIGAAIRTLGNHRDIMQTLYTQNPAQMPPESVIQIRGAYHRVSSLLETLEINDRWIGALRERAMALVTQEQSAAISRLTGLAAFFLPAIAVIALFGITGDLLSGLTPTVTLAVAGVAAVVVGALVATLTRQK